MTAQEHAGISANDYACSHPDASDDELAEVAADCSGLSFDEARRVLAENAQISVEASP